MAVDDSFKKQGAVPFKWEIKPGVPKVHQPQHQHFGKSHDHCSVQNPPVKLRPPPSGFHFKPPPEVVRTQSFRSAPRTRSKRHNSFDHPVLVFQPEIVSPGCFPSPLLRRKDDKKRIIPKLEPDYDISHSSRPLWYFSSRKSLSPFRGSPISSYSSYQSSPRPMNDAEWAGFELF